MAFSAAEQTQLKTLIVREGGLPAFTAEVSTLYIAATQASALMTLAPAITVTVADWPALSAYVAQATGITLYSVMAAITAAATARDAAQLGPLFVALYSAVNSRVS